MVTYLPLMAASDERKPVTVLFADSKISEQLPVSPWSIGHISALTLAERDMGKSVTFYQNRGLDISHGAFGRGTTGQEPAGFLEQVGLTVAGVALSKVSDPCRSRRRILIQLRLGQVMGARPFWRADGASILALKE